MHALQVRRELPQAAAVGLDLEHLPESLRIQRGEQQPVGAEIEVDVAHELVSCGPVQCRHVPGLVREIQDGDFVVPHVTANTGVALPVAGQPVGIIRIAVSGGSQIAV